MHNNNAIRGTWKREVRDTKDNAQKNKGLQVRDRSKQKTSEAYCSNGTQMLQQNMAPPFVHLTTKTRSTLEHKTYILNKKLCNKLHLITIET